ncbi:MAG: YraN family protein [Polyangiaceae bacterium]|nr:YraN family protein [Polyangiaceae bacterium]MCW5791765.1 YraN family protein [Polyangiaceae bacterium]
MSARLSWQLAEQRVAQYLVRSGFQIVATNLRVGRLELDIVARREGLIVVVEVRTRSASAWTRGLSSVDGKKRFRVRRAGERLWQRRYRHDPSAERLRFDVASVSLVEGELRIEYVPAAF